DSKRFLGFRLNVCGLHHFPPRAEKPAPIGGGGRAGVKDSFAQVRNDSLSGSGADDEEKLQ
ncbi:MAG: hypothetical protein RLN95_00435, partial [Nitratireductor sp.]